MNQRTAAHPARAPARARSHQITNGWQFRHSSPARRRWSPEHLPSPRYRQGLRGNNGRSIRQDRGRATRVAHRIDASFKRSTCEMPAPDAQPDSAAHHRKPINLHPCPRKCLRSQAITSGRSWASSKVSTAPRPPMRKVVSVAKGMALYVVA